MSVKLSTLATDYRIERTQYRTMPYTIHGKRNAVYGLFLPSGATGPKYDADKLIAITSSGRNFRFKKHGHTSWVEDDLKNRCFTNGAVIYGDPFTRCPNHITKPHHAVNHPHGEYDDCGEDCCTEDYACNQHYDEAYKCAVKLP